MIRTINKIIFFLIFLLFIFTIYLSTFGIKTDRFNNIIENQLTKYDKNISYKLNEVKIKLYPFDFKIIINTQKPEIFFNNKRLLFKNISSDIPIKFLFKKNKKINNLNIQSDTNSLKNFVSFVRLYQNNFNTLLIDKLINKGKIIFNIKLEFDDNGNIKPNFLINGNIKSAKLNLLNNEKIESSFLFEIKKNKATIEDTNILYDNLNFNSNKIKIFKKKDYFNIKGDLSNEFKNLDKKLIKLSMGILNYIENEKIAFKSNNEFEFNINKNYKLSNIKINSSLEVKEIIYEVQNKKIQDIFDVDKYVRLINHKFKVNFNVDSTKNFKNSEIIIKGKGDLKSKNYKDTINYEYFKNDKKNNLIFNVDINDHPINLKLIKYEKIKKTSSNLLVNISFKEDKSVYIKNIDFNENVNQIECDNLIISNKLKITGFDKLILSFKNIKQINNKLTITRETKNYLIQGSIFDASEIINSLLDVDDKNSIFEISNNKILLNVKNLYIDNKNFLSFIKGNIKIKNSHINLLNIESKFPNNKALRLNIYTNNKGHKITTLTTNFPKPLINRYSFVKGFEEGHLDFRSVRIKNKNYSTLIIDNFKVQEVPILAKLLTLASLQGIADLLTGEGIRFTDFEMKFTQSQNLTEIEEIYAIGPAISILMEGYIERKKLTSLRGTLVPATTINRTISSIPILGDILVGKKIGEGVFGVSFKIKGPPKDLKTTVNPIKTLTPRFITRTLEKLKD